MIVNADRPEDGAILGGSIAAVWAGSTLQGEDAGEGPERLPRACDTAANDAGAFDCRRIGSVESVLADIVNRSR